MLLTGISTIFFNINPLIKVDGYYALSSVLDLQDLREGSFRFLGTWFQKHILRLPVEVPVMTRRRKRISVVYGLLAMTYTASIMVLVGKLFNNLYTSYFPDIATALLIVTLFYIFRKRLRNVGRVGKLFYLDKKELFMSPKSRVPLAVAGGIVLLALLLPWSHRTISAESTLQPARTARLEAPGDLGHLAAVVRNRESDDLALDLVERADLPVLRGKAGRVLDAIEALFFDGRDHKVERFAVPLVDVEDIFDEFSFGQKTPYAVRDFLSYTTVN